MQKAIFFILFLFFSLGISAQEFKFEKETINYGKIKKGDDGKRVFSFTNIGKAPLIIKEIKTSCDCAIPKKPEKPIMPNEKATITVAYDTSKTGGFSKEIIIFSNAKNKIKRIKVKGYISK
ncbi:DUF1573 domain-containing protein [Polaribacter porphyrae]|uniref:DUF1573 domain-containing protein n=1 Tax=Polaribacter porphyrae TaxID=1137780 RepID=A0A2S7WMP3_9FLAO|nr:DUF1573 domain-containing protein [Polaribacter porphyrae]PQJ78853.1 hypothetical protein BTO18_06490 [Polaribacter porphyrae]